MSDILLGKHILVVEDEMMILMMIEDMLADLGCTAVHSASTVDQALALIKAHHIDAATLDVNLRGTDSYTTDANGLITSYNLAAVKLWGREPQLGVDKWCGSLRMYRVDGTLLPHGECPMAIAVKENRQIMGAEAVAERSDGTRVPFLAYPTPLHDARGIVIGAVNMLLDMTERLRTEEHRVILIAELNHRVKNMLAVIQSIASQTFSHAHASTIDEAREAFESRLINLAKTHDVLTRENWVSARLAEIVADTVRPYSGGESRFGIDGPDVFLVPSAALAIAMALHELATNAMKYGALSGNEGRVDITWRIDDEGEERGLKLNWVESGGPAVTEPTRKGFGSRLIERALAIELDGTVRIAYKPSGVICTVDAPSLKIQNKQK